jgi:pantoate--beta-alanine ligase
MTIIETISELRDCIASLRRQGKRIGFVPTMGYLHRGHLALVERARTESDIVVVSIFVNPTQFAPNEDLSTYPRDPDGDSRKLEEAGCHILFLPKKQELYPDGFSTYVAVEGIASRYEGAFRPTHFRGVSTIVAKLFNIVDPDVALFGQKDAQQVAVIRQMVRDLNFDVRLVIIDTVREPDGLAMSSRNVYLSADDRAHALSISRALTAARDAIASGGSIPEATAAMRRTLSPVIQLDYADIINEESFEPATNGDTALLGIIAGRVGKTRLIDNMRFMRHAEFVGGQ